MYSPHSPFKRISTYVDGLKFDQVKQILARVGVSYVKWLDRKHTRLMDGSDMDIGKTLGFVGVGVFIIGGIIWGGNSLYKTKRPVCADFATKQELATFIQKHPKEAKRMDRNKDNIYCNGTKVEVDLNT